MSEIIRNLLFTANRENRDASSERESFDLSAWSPYLNTRSTSEKRAERAERLIHASRQRDESAA